MILQALVKYYEDWKNKERFQGEDGAQKKFLMGFNCHAMEKFKLF